MKDAVENGPDPARLKGASLPRTATRLFLATRPMFFPASVLPVLLGTALGVREGGDLDVGVAALALGATVLVHAGANTVNDVYDDLSGTDVANLARIYPFTGGSRFIQNSILSRGAMLRWGLALLLAAAAAGLALAALKGAVVIGLGVAGGLLAVGYSAAPLRLSTRGLGEVAVGVGFGVLPVMGAAWLQSGRFSADALLISLPLALWVFNILLINEIPDMAADAQAGKRTLPVRLGRRAAAVIYAATNALALAAVAFAVSEDLLPPLAIAVPLLLAMAALCVAAKLVGAESARLVLERTIKATLAVHTFGGLWLTAFVAAS